jgi:hypothetical protein
MAALPAIEIYLERGSKRTFAAALDWPGWCRHGPSEAEALAALLDYGPRYAEILAGARLGFRPPTALLQLNVVERLKGSATTDFGALSVAPSIDGDRRCDTKTQRKLEKIIQGGWQAFDAAVRSAQDKTLTTGPRGGGRSLEAIVSHVIGADVGHLAAVGWKAPKAGPTEQLAAVRGAVLDAFRAAASGTLPAHGPRGGKRWTARWFARRVAWHLIAHTWEIERRVARPGQPDP